MHIHWDKLHETFIFHMPQPCKWDATKSLMEKLGKICFQRPQIVRTKISFFSVWLWQPQYEDSPIFLGHILWPPRETLGVKKYTMFNRIRRNLLKTNTTFKGTHLYGILRVICTVINWQHRIYNRTVKKL